MGTQAVRLPFERMQVALQVLANIPINDKTATTKLACLRLILHMRACTCSIV
jgi:hypothetical protein